MVEVVRGNVFMSPEEFDVAASLLFSESHERDVAERRATSVSLARAERMRSVHVDQVWRCLKARGPDTVVEFDFNRVLVSTSDAEAAALRREQGVRAVSMEDVSRSYRETRGRPE